MLKKVVNGQVVDYEDEVANVFPTVWGFCSENDIDDTTFYEWCKVHKEFSRAYKKAKIHQRRILFENGLTGGYNTTFSIFVSKAVCKIREDEPIKEDAHLEFDE